MSSPITLPFTSGTAGGQNGRINLNLGAPDVNGPIDSFPAYTHQTAVETNFQDDMLRGNWEANSLSKSFFSVENI